MVRTMPLVTVSAEKENCFHGCSIPSDLLFKSAPRAFFINSFGYFYMKYSANLLRISIFVVGRTGSEYGLPVAVYMKR